MKKILISTAVLMLACFGGYMFLGQAKAKEKPKEEPKAEEKKETVYTVELVEASSAEIRIFVETTATLRPEKQVDVFSKAAGQIQKLNVEEGMSVKAGTVLAELDGDSARLELDQSRVKLEKARQEFERIKKSHDNSLVSQEDFEARKFQFEQASADFKMAEYKVEITQITAPFDGTILRRSIEKGQTIQPSQACFTLASLVPLEADVFVPETAASRVRNGQKVEISRDENFDHLVVGKVKRVSPEVDSKTGTVKVTVAVENAPVDYRPGTYAHIRIITDVNQVATSIPKKALVFDSRQNASVFVATQENDQLKVKKVEVVCGSEEGQTVSIKQGLESGQKVVLTGKESLKEGSLIQDVNAVKVDQES
ncbi:MAG: efflux RND transporter periplasmic adaptor subunit [Acidobacteria bacterium]|nr:efflux RND transporter periplasmic adaptor subunit [Acidobacteriota bacterium]MCB9399480.1 efflux RND transporter periplasmic adaptor subunit [Acidobacteriota bacterium]